MFFETVTSGSGVSWADPTAANRIRAAKSFIDVLSSGVRLIIAFFAALPGVTKLKWRARRDRRAARAPGPVRRRRCLRRRAEVPPEQNAATRSLPGAALAPSRR